MYKNTNVPSVLIPPKWLQWFEGTGMEEKEKEWMICLTEKEDQIPKELQGKDVVLNGYMLPVEVIDFPLRGKLTYITFIRRRWKIMGSQESYHNEYDFHPEGAKVTAEFGAFLKELDRDEFDQLCVAWPGLRHCR